MAIRRPGIEHLLAAISGTQGGAAPPELGQQEGLGGAAPVGSEGPMPVGVGNTGGLGNPELEGMAGGGEPTEEDLQFEQMASAMNDPTTPPEVREAIQAQLAMAARRNLAGMGG